MIRNILPMAITCGTAPYFENRINIEQVISDEVQRLSGKFGKEFLDCEDIVGLTGLGRDNVRSLMKSSAFPVTKVGKRQVVGILNFVTWQVSQSLRKEE